jgi:hypothetical protein
MEALLTQLQRELARRYGSYGDTSQWVRITMREADASSDHAGGVQVRLVRATRACGFEACASGRAWGLRICGGGPYCFALLYDSATVPWYAQCRQQGGGTSGGGSGGDAVRTARMRRVATAPLSTGPWPGSASF